MKYSLLLGFLFLAVALSQTTYPLVCRGFIYGQASTGEVLHVVTLARDDSITTQFAFHRGSTSLSGYGGAVPYGTCTWTDRAVYAAEPKVIIYTSTVDKIKCRAAGGSWSCSSANPVESAIFALSRSAVPPQKTFNVYNAGTQFIITSVV